EGDPEDPPIYHYTEGNKSPDFVDVAFSAHIREVWLEWLDISEQQQEIYRETSTPQARKYEDWMVRKRVIDALHEETRQFRWRLLETVYREDVSKDRFTSPREFQERWLREFTLSETWLKLQEAGLRTLYGWIDPPR